MKATFNGRVIGTVVNGVLSTKDGEVLAHFGLSEKMTFGFTVSREEHIVGYYDRRIGLLRNVSMACEKTE